MLNKSTQHKLNCAHYLVDEICLTGKENSRTLCAKASVCLSNASLNNLLCAATTFLHQNEYVHFLKYEHDLRKHSFLLGRLAAKKALTSHFNTKGQDKKYNVKNGLLGEPLLSESNTNIAIAHTNSYGISIVTDQLFTLGLDIEHLDHMQNLDSNFYNNNEIKMLIPQTQSKEEKEAQCFIWTAKEALVKYLKTGFTVPFEILEIKSIHLTGDIFVISFKNFHALSVLAFKINKTIVAICVLKSIDISLEDLKLFSIKASSLIN